MLNVPLVKMGFLFKARSRYLLIFLPLTGADTFIPLGEAANLVLLSEDEIFEAATALLESTAG